LDSPTDTLCVPHARQGWKGDSSNTGPPAAPGDVSSSVLGNSPQESPSEQKGEILAIFGGQERERDGLKRRWRRDERGEN